MQTLDPHRRRLALALAALAGFVDAAGYLSADRYFVSFMSGNTTRLGVELARQPSAALVPALLALAFVAGVVGGAVLVARREGHHKPALLLAVAGLLALGGLLGSHGATYPSLLILAAAMGALNNSFSRAGQVAVGLTYMTGALVRMGQGIAARLAGKAAAGWSDWLALWFALACGATVGAFAQFQFGHGAFWIAAACAVLLAVAARRIPAADG